MSAAEYELVLMLDPEAADERRDQIASEARRRIESSAELKADTTWGMRKLAYEIRQRTEADYRFFRFQGESGLLDELNHNLKITDGVLRFRIFRVDPEAPVIEPPPPVALSGSTSGRGPGGRRGGSGRRDDFDDRSPPPSPPPAEPAPAANEAPAAEPARAEASPDAAEPEVVADATAPEAPESSS